MSRLPPPDRDSQRLHGLNSTGHMNTGQGQPSNQSSRSGRKPTLIHPPTSLDETSELAPTPAKPQPQKKPKYPRLIGASLPGSPFLAGGNPKRGVAKPSAATPNRGWGDSSFNHSPEQSSKRLDVTNKAPRTQLSDQAQNRDARQRGQRQAAQRNVAGAAKNTAGQGKSNAIEVDDDDDEAGREVSPSVCRGPAKASSSVHAAPRTEPLHRHWQEKDDKTEPQAQAKAFWIGEEGTSFSDSDNGDAAELTQRGGNSTQRSSVEASQGDLTRDVSMDVLDCVSDSKESQAPRSPDLGPRRNADPVRPVMNGKGKGKASEHQYLAEHQEPDPTARIDNRGNTLKNSSAGPRRSIASKMQPKTTPGLRSAGQASERPGKAPAASTLATNSSKASVTAAAQDRLGPSSKTIFSGTIMELPLKRLVLGRVEVEQAKKPALVINPKGPTVTLQVRKAGEVVTIPLPQSPRSLNLQLGDEETLFVSFEPCDRSSGVQEMEKKANEAIGSLSYDHQPGGSKVIYCFVAGDTSAEWSRAIELLQKAMGQPEWIKASGLRAMHEAADRAVEMKAPPTRAALTNPADAGRQGVETGSSVAAQSPTTTRPRPRSTVAIKGTGNQRSLASPHQVTQSPRQIQTRASGPVPAQRMYPSAATAPAGRKSGGEKGHVPAGDSGALRRYDATPRSPVVSEPDVQRFRYPVDGPGGVMVYQSDIDKLVESEFLNDTIIEWGLKVILDSIRQKDPELADSIYIFSSFFYKRLTQSRDRNASFEFVRKWTSKVDLFAKRFIIVPINENLHWFLAIIVNPSYAFDPKNLADAKDAVAAATQHFKRHLPRRKSNLAIPDSEDESANESTGARSAKADAMDTAADPDRPGGEGDAEVADRLESLRVGDGQLNDELMDEVTEERSSEHGDNGALALAHDGSRPEADSDVEPESHADVHPEVDGLPGTPRPAEFAEGQEVATPSSPTRVPMPSSSLSSVQSNSSESVVVVIPGKRAAPGTPSQGRRPTKRRLQDSSPAKREKGIPVVDLRSASTAELRTQTEVASIEHVGSASDGIMNGGRGKMRGGGPSGASSSQASIRAYKKGTPIQPSTNLDSDDEAATAGTSRPAASSSSRFCEASPFERSSAPPSEHEESTNAPRPGHSPFSSQTAKPVDDALADQVSKHTTVLVFDSLQASHKGVASTLREYLAREWRARRDANFDLSANDAALKSLVKHIDVKAPQQPNFCDCGVYLLHYVECIFADLETFLRHVIPSKDRKHPSWHDQTVAAKRAAWREKAAVLSKEWEELQRLNKERKRAAKEKQEAEAEAEADKALEGETGDVVVPQAVDGQGVGDSERQREARAGSSDVEDGKSASAPLGVGSGEQGDPSHAVKAGDTTDGVDEGAEESDLAQSD